ncbi:MAG: hypothetical protein AAB842_00890 [Patescibacteria group bacterium]
MNKLKSSSVIAKKIFIFGVLIILCLALIFFIRYNFIKKVIESKELDLGKMLGLEKLQEASEDASKGIEERSKAMEDGFKKLQEEYLQSTSSASSSETIAATSTINY